MASAKTETMSALSFGTFLRERRTRLDPSALGIAGGRRRTAGLRREEVAQRALISTTWYSWLEQGRGGAPSAQVVERLAAALMLTTAEREHLFLLGLGRPPEARYRPPGGITPRLQRVLDGMELCPAMVRTATWDVVAWNHAFTRVMTDWGSVPPAERNVLRRIFLHPAPRVMNADWEGLARFVVSAFRGDTARAGAATLVQPFVEQLCRESEDFARLWRDADVAGLDEGEKRLRHPEVGEIVLEFSSFAVDGRPDLVMLVHTPVGPTDRARVRMLVEGAGCGQIRVTTE